VRIVIVISLILVAGFIGGLYGALYDQFTYSVSNEFFTKMRFTYFGVADGTFTRWEVAKIGFRSTWSEGLILGIFLTLAGLLHQDNKRLIIVTLQSFGIALFIGFIFGLSAYLFAGNSEMEVGELSSNIIDKQAYQRVSKMNNYSHVGGVIGMFIGLGWQVFHTRKHSRK